VKPLLIVFYQKLKNIDIDINLNEEVLSIDKSENDALKVKTTKQTYTADAVICSIGGHHQEKIMPS
jgi:thioredoxin reductase